MEYMILSTLQIWVQYLMPMPVLYLLGCRYIGECGYKKCLCIIAYITEYKTNLGVTLGKHMQVTAVEQLLPAR